MDIIYINFVEERKKMANVNDVSPGEIVKVLAEKLKKNEYITAPSWASLVKTGVSKDRPPVQLDWWQIRAASVLLKINKYGPIGVSKLRTIYGDKKNRGVKPEKFFKASGNILRKILQQLDKAGYTKQAQVDVYKGRVITKEGKLLLNTVASEVQSMPKVEKKKVFAEEKKAQSAPKQAATPVGDSDKNQKRSAQVPKSSKKGEQ